MIFIINNINTLDSKDDFSLTLMSGVAQVEILNTSNRVKWGHKRQMKNGVVFGIKPFGFIEGKGKLVINENEAETVRLIFRKFLNENKGTSIIARELCEKNTPSPGKKGWRSTAVLRILQNEKYVGDLVQGKTYTPNFLDHDNKKTTDTANLIKKPEHHTAIIDRDIWDRTQAELNRRSAAAEKKVRQSGRYWCSNKVKCGECGSSFVATNRNLDTYVYKSWQCYRTRFGSQRDESGKLMGCENYKINDTALLQCCQHVLKLVEINYKEIVDNLILDIETIEGTMVIRKTTSQTNEIAVLNEDKINTIILRAKNEISYEDLAKARIKFDKSIELLENKIREIENENAIMKEQQAELGGYLQKLRSICYQNLCDEEVCRGMLEKAIVNKDKTVVIYLNCLPFGVKLTFAISGKRESYQINVISEEYVYGDSE